MAYHGCNSNQTHLKPLKLCPGFNDIWWLINYSAAVGQSSCQTTTMANCHSVYLPSHTFIHLGQKLMIKQVELILMLIFGSVVLTAGLLHPVFTISFVANIIMWLLIVLVVHLHISIAVCIMTMVIDHVILLVLLCLIQFWMYLWNQSSKVVWLTFSIFLSIVINFI